MVVHRGGSGTGSDTEDEGVVIDFDAEGHLIGIEVLDASLRFSLQDLVNVSIENLPVEMVK
jgi:uncharacterized protein YuzE